MFIHYYSKAFYFSVLFDVFNDSSVPCQVMSVLSGLICWQVLNMYFEQTPPDKDVRWMNVTRVSVCGLSGSRSFGIL